MWKIKQVCHDFLKDKRRGNYSLHMISNENPTDFVRFLIINVRWLFRDSGSVASHLE